MQPQPADAFYERLEERAFVPGWRRKRPNVWPTPVSRFKPAVWRFAEARAALDASVGFLPPEDTERRNLLMVNPFEGNTYPTTSSLISAYQMVAPGESAPAHRHSPAALRVVLQAPRGAVTVVDGRAIEMAAGDVVFTPSGCWHAHLNDSPEPAYWIDFLDVPLVQHLEAMFFERRPDAPTADAPDAASPLRFRTLQRLQGGADEQPVPCEGMPTIGVSALRLAAGGLRSFARSTASSIYAVIEGRASVELEGGAFAASLDVGDVVAVPCWLHGTLRSDTGARLVRVSDEPLLRLAGLLRQEESIPQLKETT